MDGWEVVSLAELAAFVGVARWRWKRKPRHKHYWEIVDQTTVEKGAVPEAVIQEALRTYSRTDIIYASKISNIIEDARAHQEVVTTYRCPCGEQKVERI